MLPAVSAVGSGPAGLNPLTATLYSRRRSAFDADFIARSEGEVRLSVDQIPDFVRERMRVEAEIAARIAAGSSPEADARRAIAQNCFGLMLFGSGRAAEVRAPGVYCATPGGRAPERLALRHTGCAISPEMAAWRSYATIYNRTIVSHPDYPDADLCRPLDEGEKGTKRISPGRRDVSSRRRGLFSKQRGAAAVGTWPIFSTTAPISMAATRSE